ncbi:MAG TPA: Rieske 2Fe-2S domain-containing protein [Gemmatimonadales bacterium]
MSVHYQAVNWNRQKRLYDSSIAVGCAAFLAVFTGLSLNREGATLETSLIRGLGALAFILLHVILCIGPLARLDRRFLPLLYNRRHLGVTMALVALAHATFATLQYHSAADVNPLVSVLAGAPGTHFPTAFPFEWLGMAALVILLLMAATSHDFWLSVLTPRVWKTLHMAVYLAYGLLVLHVALGIHQAEPGTITDILLLAGMGAVFGLHLSAGIREWRRDRPSEPGADGWVEVCAVDEIPEGRARGAVIGGERVAVFRYDGKVSCVSGVCRHQNGPLAEGRIVDGCITCPWHGYQYLPDSGTSPPPYNDVIPTYDVRIVGSRVFVDPRAHPPGTRVEPARVA